MKLPGIHDPSLCPGCQTGYPCRVVTRRHHRYWENYVNDPDLWGPILARDAVADAVAAAPEKKEPKKIYPTVPGSLKEDPPIPRQKKTYRIGLDLTSLTGASAPRGIGQYSLNLVFALCRLAPEAEFVGYKNILGKIGCDFRNLRNLKIRNLKGFPEDRIRDNEDQLDAYLVLSPVEGCLPDRRGIPLMASVAYDLIPHLFPQQYPLASHHDYVEVIRDYDVLLTMSESSKADFVLHKYFDPYKIKVVGSSCSEFFKIPETDFREPYVLYVGTADYHKGSDALLEGFGLLPRELKEKYELCYSFLADQKKLDFFQEKARELGVRIKNLGYNYGDRLASLYQRATLTGFPSRYEGFGLPLLESIKCGTPVIYGDNSSQPEVAGDAGIPCVPDDPADVARALELGLNPDINFQLREKCVGRAKLFSWERVADKALKALKVPEKYIRESFVEYHSRSLPVVTPPSRVTLRWEHLASWTGYGNIGLSLVKSLESLGVEVDLEAWTMDEGFRALPEDVRRKVNSATARSPWCIWLSTPHGLPPEGRKLLYFTMWEVSRFSPRQIENLEKAEAVFVPCEANREWLQESGLRKPIYVIPLGVEPCFTPAPISFEPLVFGTAGRTAHGGSRKNIGSVAAAFANVCDRIPNSVLKIKIFEDCVIPRWVEKHPRIEVDRTPKSLEEMADWYRSLTVYVTASKGEGWGRQTHEAMACGRPVIAVPWSATTDFWRPGVDGWALEFDEQEPSGYDRYEGFGARWAVPTIRSLEENFLHVSASPEEILSYSKNAAEQAQKFTWEKTARKLRRVLGIVGAIPRETNEVGRILDSYEEARACPYRKNPGCGCQGGQATCGVGGRREGKKVTLQECAHCREEYFNRDR